MFSKGPLTVARFGRHLIWRTNWPEGAFEEMQKRLVEQFPKVVAEIDTLVSEIASLVSKSPAAQLLHRAWWEAAHRHTQLETEAEVTSDDALSVRMIDYVQSVIAAVPAASDQTGEVTEEDWVTLRSKVGRVFEKINGEYQICLTAKNKAEDPNFDENLEEFRVRAELCWCNVRGRRYQAHDPAYLQDMFLPHSGVLQELFGISGEEFANEITKIWRTLTFGLGDAISALADLERDVGAALREKGRSYAPSSAPDSPALMAQVLAEKGWESRASEIRGLFDMDLFDVQKVASLPRALLDELSWAPGEEETFFADGDLRGWPLRVWPIFRRPFIRLNGHYYCFDLYSLTDHIYRAVQRVIRRLEPSYDETWNRVQKDISEGLPLQYLERLLPGVRVLREVYYRGRTDAGTVDWCETDGLLIYDDHLFVIEARGGAFTYTPPATNSTAYVKSLKDLLRKPARQGTRFVEYLGSSDAVALFDKRHRQIGELSRKHFRNITVCAVTLDPFTEIAAQVQHLRKIGIDVGSEPVWALSVDDLRVYADIFESPLVFLHYVEQRMQAFRSEVVQPDDELDHLGLYLRQNCYSDYAAELHRKSPGRTTFAGYRSDIDKFFTERLHNPNFPCPLKQSIPLRMWEIVQYLSRTSTPGRAEVASFLLDLDGESRSAISKSIDTEIKQQPNAKRPKPFSTHAGVNLTVFCWVDGCAPRNAALALEHGRTVFLTSGDSRRLLLELSYTNDGRLHEVAWRWIDLMSIPPSMLPALRASAERLRETRVANAKLERRKIRRNEQCPCGSGKKYKRCCLGR